MAEECDATADLNGAGDWYAKIASQRMILSGLFFLCEGNSISEPLGTMPGVERHSVDRIGAQAKLAQKLGIPALAIFANVAMEKRNQTGSEVLSPDNIIVEATKAIKDAAPDVGVITDVALDLFTDHGHDGILRDGIIVNDETVETLAKAAVLQADAGADIISASEMMDGRMGAIRDALNFAGHTDIGTLAYTAKYASGYYGPYREAVGTDGLLKGDKRTYFMDPANSDEALYEAQLDIAEGSDMIMVKPGMPYLDIIHRLKTEFGMPTFAYQVSGEYSMIMAGVEKGFVEEQRVIMESLTCFKRAGADAILTYFAPRVAQWLNDQ